MPTTQLDEFSYVRDVLSGHQIGDPTLCQTRCYRRLLSALRSERTSAADRAALVRQVIRHESTRPHGAGAVLTVPVEDRWPDKDLWALHGVDAFATASGFLQLRARPWRPDWLRHIPDEGLDAAACGEKTRREDQRVTGDPFLQILGRSTYLSPGQRQAVRAVLSAPPGSTLVVNLPTGSGKSLCAHIQSLVPSMPGHGGGVVVVVVPTTALCLDQARTLAPHFPHPTAYFAGSDDESKLRNLGIRQRIADGTQGIVFTSPESVIGSLKPVLYRAARQGYIRAFVVDETHMVDQWGDDFRSPFQEMAGLRRRLLRECAGSPFTTTLLSATLTETTLDMLEGLFGTPGPFAMVSAAQVRPEPAYWLASCQSESVKQERLMEALRHLPRPLILYTTRVNDAKSWGELLASAGYRRFAVMTGKSHRDERERIIREWAAAKLDIVVATSAFGLGVDKDDVRAVVHACVPETLDRFYQEVGRGGRDGRASISLMAYTGKDVKTGHSMGQRRLIGLERGLQRWAQMFDNKERTEDPDRFRVPVDVPPGYTVEDIDMQSELNEDWNIRTLTLMSRAGMLELDDDPPPIPSPESEGATPEGRWRVVRVLAPDHLREEAWERRVKPLREDAQRRGNLEWEFMTNVLHPHCCIGEILQRAYDIPARRSEPRRPEVSVSLCCGGCPFCRKVANGTVIISPPTPPPPWAPSQSCGPRLATICASTPWLGLFYPVTESRDHHSRRMSRLLRWCIGEGVQCVVAPSGIWDSLLEERPELARRPIFCATEYSLDLPRVPTVVFHASNAVIPRYPLRSSETRRAPTILVLPENARDPEKPDCLLRDLLSCPHFHLEEFEEREVL